MDIIKELSKFKHIKHTRKERERQNENMKTESGVMKYFFLLSFDLLARRFQPS